VISPAVVDNGAFPAFFYNSPADHYSETLDALHQLGLSDDADLLERAAAACSPLPYHAP
jgi:hypothetical protein